MNVASGDAVTAGQQLLVLEAMKMQNEFRAPREGIVDRVAVAVGETVEIGDLLLVIRVSREPRVPAGPDPVATPGARPSGRRPSSRRLSGGEPFETTLGHRDPPTCTPRPTRPASTRHAISGRPGSTRSPAASSRRCTGVGFWTMRQYAGFATAAETNERFRYLLEQGQTGLSVAFDLPTQMGYDCDAPEAEGEVGRVGVPISSLADMETLFAGIPLGTVSTSMTINATAAILLALYVAAAERQGVPRSG